jgi:hypothetical protein
MALLRSAPMPNSGQTFMSNNSQSDTEKTQPVPLLARHNPLYEAKRGRFSIASGWSLSEFIGLTFSELFGISRLCGRSVTRENRAISYERLQLSGMELCEGSQFWW